MSRVMREAINLKLGVAGFAAIIIVIVAAAVAAAAKQIFQAALENVGKRTASVNGLFLAAPAIMAGPAAVSIGAGGNANGRQ